jgi:hypothetical protein
MVVPGLREGMQAVWLGRQAARDPEVHDLDAAIGGEQHVLGLEIAVHDAVPVSGVQRLGELEEDLERPRGRQASIRQRGAERDASHELAREVQLAVDLLERVDRRDCGMGQRRGGACLACQALARAGVAAERARQHLQRDGAAQAIVAGGVHHAHAAAADFLADFVRADTRARERGVGRFVEELGGDRPCGTFEEGAGRVVRAQQGAHFVGDSGIGFGRAREQALTIRGAEIQRLVEQRADAAPVGRQLSSSRASHARASAQWRFTVAGEMSIACAVSSIDRPPKNRSSTIRACPASSAARRSSAASRATMSNPRSFACAGRPSSKVTAARRRRASARRARGRAR